MINLTWDEICDNRNATFNWTSQVPDLALIKNVIQSVHNYAPSKQRRVRYNIDVLANYSDIPRRNEIYAGTLSNPDKPTSRYNPQVLAPWLLSFSIRPEANVENRSAASYEVEAWIDVGIAVQHTTLAATAMGLDVGFCLCIQNRGTDPLHNNRNPIMYMGLGHADPATEYFCPIRKQMAQVPVNAHDTKPTLEEYVYYK